MGESSAEIDGDAHRSHLPMSEMLGSLIVGGCTTSDAASSRSPVSALPFLDLFASRCIACLAHATAAACHQQHDPSHRRLSHFPYDARHSKRVCHDNITVVPGVGARPRRSPTFPGSHGTSRGGAVRRDAARQHAARGAGCDVSAWPRNYSRTARDGQWRITAKRACHFCTR